MRRVDEEALADTYATFVVSRGLPGLIAGCVSPDRLEWCAGYGLSNVSEGQAPSIDTVFRIASMTKCFTALAILQLRDAGALRLDDPVKAYVPQLAGVAAPSGDAAPVTIRDLLNHTAGLVTDDPWADRELGMSARAFDALLEAGGLWARASGLGFEYSNLGYAILGRIIARASGKSFQTFIHDALLAPLGMLHTSFDQRVFAPQEVAVGYRGTPSAWRSEPPEPDGDFGSMGGLWTTAGDYARFVAFLLSAWPARDTPDNGPVRRGTVRELGQTHASPVATVSRKVEGGEALVANAYGYGMMHANDGRLGRYLHHMGGLPGFGSHVLVSPECGIGLFAFGNLTYCAPSTANLAAADRLLDLGAWKPREIEASPALVAAAAWVRAAFADQDVSPDPASIAPNLLADIDRDDRKAELVRLHAAYGPAQAINLSPQHRLAARFTLCCARGDIHGRVVLTPEVPPRVQLLTFDDGP